jgi:hypothetical protein
MLARSLLRSFRSLSTEAQVIGVQVLDKKGQLIESTPFDVSKLSFYDSRKDFNRLSVNYNNDGRIAFCTPYMVARGFSVVTEESGAPVYGQKRPQHLFQVQSCIGAMRRVPAGVDYAAAERFLDEMAQIDSALAKWMLQHPDVLKNPGQELPSGLLEGQISSVSSRDGYPRSSRVSKTAWMRRLRAEEGSDQKSASWTFQALPVFDQAREAVDPSTLQDGVVVRVVFTMRPFVLASGTFGLQRVPTYIATGVAQE